MRRVLTILATILASAPVCGAEPIEIGSQRELFVDDSLLDRRAGVELRLQAPVPREVVMVYDAPWEGSGCCFATVFRDGPIIRKYYIAHDLTWNADGTKRVSRPTFACYAESRDGIRWVRPELGLFDYNGSKKNNIIWSGPKLDNFTPMKDPNPDCRPGEEYKAVGVALRSYELWAYKSADGLHWSPLVDKPILTRGRFDTQNNAFWDPLRKHYWCYIRDYHFDDIRDIRVATSNDFLTWTEPQKLHFPDAPDEQLYTNQVRPYYRAPHLFLGFPTRYIKRPWTPSSIKALPDPEHRQRRMTFKTNPIGRYGTALTDGLFMTSRDGRTFHRWDEAFLRPGPERRDNWVYGDCYQSLGLLETPATDPTAPPELSFYVGENHWKGPVRLRRYTVRIDGFVSLHARSRGECVTKPLVFHGKELTLNFSTSAAGYLRVELQDAGGQPLPEFTLADSDELFGDSLERVVTWKGKSNVAALAGQPVRVRFVMRDADLYSFRFQE